MLKFMFAAALALQAGSALASGGLFVESPVDLKAAFLRIQSPIEQYSVQLVEESSNRIRLNVQKSQVQVTAKAGVTVTRLSVGDLVNVNDLFDQMALSTESLEILLTCSSSTSTAQNLSRAISEGWIPLSFAIENARDRKNVAVSALIKRVETVDSYMSRVLVAKGIKPVSQSAKEMELRLPRLDGCDVTEVQSPK